MKTIFLSAILFATSATAEPMRFQAIHNGGNCVGCAYTQATGEITSETPKDFERYLASEQFPGSVRLHSPGGSLVGGIALGEALRANSIPTEVGSSQH